ncbi:unnamed protein product [Zymoseptoria tritici ST99CH_3D7]|uniref:P-loop containing nucleoside triphosphate hydrolase protein n=1 Tax=Zymoseptoria tritici (strain ST99CH_3D7) TaxID=1276538 RepID=A0A1X7REP0_ZYMT9|nr:unnamed protein product [Zymoseptoria tritici ST99CH_3D7]
MEGYQQAIGKQVRYEDMPWPMGMENEGGLVRPIAAAPARLLPMRAKEIAQPHCLLFFLQKESGFAAPLMKCFIAHLTRKVSAKSTVSYASSVFIISSSLIPPEKRIMMPSSRFMLPLLSISLILLLIAHQLDFSSSSSLFPRPPKVFVLGLSKTGTTSIGDALEILGYRRLGWADTRSRIMVHTWMNGGKATNLELSQLWDAFEDLPWPVMYREMAEKYPDAKFLLSRRKDEETWLRSMAVHVGRGKWKPYAYFYGADTFEGNEDTMRQAYRDHMRDVRAFFNDKPDRLWEMSIDDDGDVNWDVLCQIAQCPGGKPPKVQFPRSNTQATWERGWLDESRRWVEGWIVTKIEELITHHCYHGEWQVFVKPLMRAIGSMYMLDGGRRMTAQQCPTSFREFA